MIRNAFNQSVYGKVHFEEQSDKKKLPCNTFERECNWFMVKFTLKNNRIKKLPCDTFQCEFNWFIEGKALNR